MKGPGRSGIVHSASPLFAVGLALVVGGCSSFHRAWREAERHPAPENSIQGCWEGQWVSEVNGHHGQLRCLISLEADGDYSARFRATYLKVLRFSYTVRLQVEHGDGAWHFHGEEDLGKLAGGVYHYTGHATQTEFHSTYRSKYDHGKFEMRRLDGDPNPARP